MSSSQGKRRLQLFEAGLESSPMSSKDWRRELAEDEAKRKVDPHELNKDLFGSARGETTTKAWGDEIGRDRGGKKLGSQRRHLKACFVVCQSSHGDITSKLSE